MITILDSAGNISMTVIRHVIKKPGVMVMAKLEEDSPAGKFYSGTSFAYDGMLSKSHFDTSLGSMEAAIDYAESIC